MKKITKLLMLSILTANAFWASILWAHEQDQKAFYGLQCPGLKINFLGPRYADKISFVPNFEFFAGIISENERQRSLYDLKFFMMTEYGTCQRGEGNELLHCQNAEDSLYKQFANVSFSYIEEIENSEFSQSVTIGRGIELTSWDLRVVTYLEIDPRTQKENTAAKLVFKGQIKSSQGIKELNYQQRVGQWLDPILSDRSEYGLCLFKSLS